MPHPPLTPADRKVLKARAHALDPVVIVGDAGLTAGVLAEIERSLVAHELIKIRVTGDDRDARLAMRDRIVGELSAQSVQDIGKLIIVFRRRPFELETPVVPAKRARKAAASKKWEPIRKVSTRKAKTGAHPPRTDRIRKAGQRSTKKPHQTR